MILSRTKLNLGTQAFSTAAPAICNEHLDLKKHLKQFSAKIHKYDF